METCLNLYFREVVLEHFSLRCSWSQQEAVITGTSKLAPARGHDSGRLVGLGDTVTPCQRQSNTSQICMTCVHTVTKTMSVNADGCRR